MNTYTVTTTVIAPTTAAYHTSDDALDIMDLIMDGMTYEEAAALVEACK